MNSDFILTHNNSSEALEIEASTLKIAFVDYYLPVALLLRTQLFCDALSNEFAFRFEPPNNLDVSEFKSLVFSEIPYSISINGGKIEHIALKKLEIANDKIQIEVYGDYVHADMVFGRLYDLINKSLGSLGFEFKRQPYIKKIATQLNLNPAWRTLSNLIDPVAYTSLLAFGQKQLNLANTDFKDKSINYSSNLLDIQLTKLLIDIIPSNSYHSQVSLTLEHINNDTYKLGRVKIAGNFQSREIIAWSKDLEKLHLSTPDNTMTQSRVDSFHTKDHDSNLLTNDLLVCYELYCSANKPYSIKKIPLVWLFRSGALSKFLNENNSQYCLQTYLKNWQWFSKDSSKPDQEPLDWSPDYVLLQGGSLLIEKEWEPFLDLKITFNSISITSPRSSHHAEKLLANIEERLIKLLQQDFLHTFTKSTLTTEFTTSGKVKMAITPFALLNSEVQKITINHFSKILQEVNVTYSETGIFNETAKMESIHIFTTIFTFYPQGRSARSTELRFWFNEYSDFYNSIWNFFGFGDDQLILNLLKELNTNKLKDFCRSFNF